MPLTAAEGGPVRRDRTYSRHGSGVAKSSRIEGSATARTISAMGWPESSIDRLIGPPGRAVHVLESQPGLLEGGQTPAW